MHFVLVDIGEVPSPPVLDTNFCMVEILQLLGMLHSLVLARGLPWELQKISL